MLTNLVHLVQNHLDQLHPTLLQGHHSQLLKLHSNRILEQFSMYALHNVVSEKLLPHTSLNLYFSTHSQARGSYLFLEVFHLLKCSDDSKCVKNLQTLLCRWCNNI